MRCVSLRPALLSLALALVGLMNGTACTGLSEPWEDVGGRTSLKGLPGVEVVVAPFISSKAKRAGTLSEREMQTEMESMLQKAGIPVLSGRERRETNTKPRLFLQAIAPAGQPDATELETDCRV